MVGARAHLFTSWAGRGSAQEYISTFPFCKRRDASTGLRSAKGREGVDAEWKGRVSQDSGTQSGMVGARAHLFTSWAGRGSAQEYISTFPFCKGRDASTGLRSAKPAPSSSTSARRTLPLSRPVIVVMSP